MDGEGEGLADGVVVGVGVGEGDAEGLGLGVGVTLGFIEGLGVALTVGFIEAFGVAVGDGEGEGVGSGVGAGVGLGLGELASPRTPEEGRKIDFKKRPEPIKRNNKTAESMRVGFEGLLNINALYIKIPKGRRNFFVDTQINRNLCDNGMMLRDWFSVLVTTVLLMLFFYLLASPVNLAAADLGRHIRNGEQLLSGNFDLLYTNYYSYTYPEFPFVNHHWLGGVIFYVIASFSGITGVQLLFITINSGAFLIFLYVAKKYSNVVVSSILALLILPVIAYRAEVRPEVFSYLLAGIYYLVCKGFLEGQFEKKWLYILPVLQLIWVNTHIYFFIGLFIIGIFWLESLIIWLRLKRGESFADHKNFTIVGLLCFLGSFLNPHFLNGLIYPFQILGSYGYRVLENQSVFFLENIIEVPAVFYFKIVLGLMLLSWIFKIYRLVRFREGLSIANLILSVSLSYLALTQIRNLALFGFFALPIIAINLKSVRLEMSRYLLFPVLGIIFIFLLVVNPGYWESRAFGLGPAPGIERGAEFFVRENIKGPIFNNYDIGGYLIFYLFPKEKVFVDNRPEGYPVEFFKKSYVPMQESEEVWEAKAKEYNFNSIFFYRNDLTPWAQKFLVARIKDAQWAPVFVDNYNIIFLRRNEQNSDLIKKYELPGEMFRVNNQET